MSRFGRRMFWFLPLLETTMSLVQAEWVHTCKSHNHTHPISKAHNHYTHKSNTHPQTIIHTHTPNSLIDFLFECIHPSAALASRPLMRQTIFFHTVVHYTHTLTHTHNQHNPISHTSQISTHTQFHTHKYISTLHTHNQFFHTQSDYTHITHFNTHTHTFLIFLSRLLILALDTLAYTHRVLLVSLRITHTLSCNIHTLHHTHSYTLSLSPSISLQNIYTTTFSIHSVPTPSYTHICSL